MSNAIDAKTAYTRAYRAARLARRIPLKRTAADCKLERELRKGISYPMQDKATYSLIAARRIHFTGFVSFNGDTNTGSRRYNQIQFLKRRHWLNRRRS